MAGVQHNTEEMKAHVHKILQIVTVDFYGAGISKLIGHYNKYLDRQGDNIEK